MNYYYIGTWEECEAYNDLVASKLGFNGATTRWDDQVKLEDGRWAITLNGCVEVGILHKQSTEVLQNYNAQKSGL